MASWRIKLAAIALAALVVLAAPSAWPASHACGAEDQKQTSKKGTVAEVAKGKEGTPKLYDTEADGKKLIEESLKLAKGQNKRVLLKFGDNGCGWCHRLSKCFKTEPRVAKALNDNYVLVLIDVDPGKDGRVRNAGVIERYGNPIRFGLPTLVVLDADGKQLTTQNTALLEEGDHHDPKKVLAFLEKYKPEEDEDTVIEVESIPHYTELLEWINDVQRPGFKLLKAAKQNGYLIAVFKTDAGDVAICSHRLEGTALPDSLEVTDLAGNDLDDESESHRGRSFLRTLKTPDSTVRFLDGYIYPLRRPVPKKVRVIFNVGEGEAGLVPDQKTIFNEIIEME